MHISSNNLARKAAKLPSVATYRRKVQALIDRYRPQGVRTWGSMNEANHDSQPTWNNPRARRAVLPRAARASAGAARSSRLDVLDQRGVERYIRRFYSALGRAGRWRRSSASTTTRTRTATATAARGSILRTVKRYNPRAQFWLTETGGVAKFGTSFPCNPASPAAPSAARPARSNFMFTLTKRFRRDIKRLYIYNFTGADCQERFDAGLVRRDGTARPAYNAVKRQLRNFKR